MIHRQKLWTRNLYRNRQSDSSVQEGVLQIDDHEGDVIGLSETEGQYMLIDAVDECAVKIEEESRAMRRMLSHGYEILPSGKSYLQEMASLRGLP